MSFPAGETVVLVRPGAPTEDDYGNDVPGTATETNIAGAVVAPRTSGEDVQGRDQVVVGLNVWLPAGTHVQPTDRLMVRGVLYEVDGEPGAWRSPFTGISSPVQVSLTRVAG